MSESGMGEHPARIEHFTKALYESEEGQVAMAYLRDLFRTAPAFRLTTRPRDEWDYISCLIKEVRRINFPGASERAEGLEVLERRHRERFARITELTDELRQMPEGEGAAEALEWVLSRVPELAQWRHLGGAWTLLAGLVTRLKEDDALCERLFPTQGDAFAVGADFAAACTLHEHVCGPFRDALEYCRGT